MTELQTLNLTGASGGNYTCHAYSLRTELLAVAAVYVMMKCYRGSDGRIQYQVIYVGQTSDLSDRFADHHKNQCFARNGVNCIAVHRDGSKESRLAKERDLIKSYRPACNG